MEQQLTERAWSIALGHYLSNYPMDKSPEEIMALITEDSDEITYWEPFEYSDPEWMAEHIETMKDYMIGELQWARQQ